MRRTEAVRVDPGDRSGYVYRPSLLGAILGKAAALSIQTAPPDRHYRDLAFLLSLVPNPLELKVELTRSDRKQLARAHASRDINHPAWRQLRDESARLDGQLTYRLLIPAS